MKTKRPASSRLFVRLQNLMIRFCKCSKDWTRTLNLVSSNIISKSLCIFWPYRFVWVVYTEAKYKVRDIFLNNLKIYNRLVRSWWWKSSRHFSRKISLSFERTTTNRSFWHFRPMRLPIHETYFVKCLSSNLHVKYYWLRPRLKGYRL